MILIAHRGNLNGKNIERENSPKYIRYALNKSFHVEIDLWYLSNDGKLYLGHDKPQYEIGDNFFNGRMWIHCKTIQTVVYMLQNHSKRNFFFHGNDMITLTSKNIIWNYPGVLPTSFSIVHLKKNEPLPKNVYGVCSDYIGDYL